LETFASHAALALKNARLLAQRQRTRRAAAAIAGVTIQEDLGETLQTITRHARTVLRSDIVTIYAYDEARKVFEQWATENPEARDPGAALPPDQLSEQSTVHRILALAAPPLYFLADEQVREDPWLGGDYVVTEEICASFSIQLRVGEHRVGVMFVSYRAPHRFTADEIDTIQLFADQAALAIRNAQLYCKLRERVNVMESLYQAGQAITSSLALSDVLSHITEQAWNLAEPSEEKRAQFSNLALVAGDKLQFAAAYPPEYIEDLKERIEKIDLSPRRKGRVGITGRVVQTGESTLVGDVSQDPDYIEADSDTNSELAVPVIVGDQVIGVINVEHTELNAFDRDDLHALEALASQAAMAIQNARLYQAEQQSVRELEGLYQISQAIRSLTDLHDVYQQINENMANLMDVEKCAILIHDEEQETLVCQVPAYGLTDDFAHKYSIPVGEGQPAVMWQEQDTLIINDLKEYSLVSELRMSHMLEKSGTKHTLLAKLEAGAKSIGIVQVSNKLDGTRFNKDDARLLFIFAAQAAAVIENARLYDDLRQTKGLVGARTALAWMGMTSSAWRHTIDKHALTIREQGELLRRDWRRVISHPRGTKVEERIKIIERLANQILEKPITPPLPTEEGLEVVSLTALIAERARQLWQNDPHRRTDLKLDLQLPEDVAIRLSPEWLRRAFDILADNAVAAVMDCDLQEITICTRAARGGAEILVSDTGPGIPKEIRTKIGLEPIQKLGGAQGLGMGLLIAHTIVQTYAGEIRVVASGPDGTTMAIWLPLEREEAA
jgi:GAF domain-containing protein